VFAKVGDGRADGNFVMTRGMRDRHGERTVGGGDVGVEMEIWAEDGGTMLAEKNDDGENKSRRGGRDAEVFAMGHWENE